MIIEHKPLDVTLQGISENEINYAIIESNPVIMDILSNKMYKNKIGTICREILSNAKDACIEAGVNTPIEVHIPTMLEPWFSIKDFGIGLNEYDLVNIYGNYGRSTKRDSNNSIGGFGLGGKTPYIYNNQFTVIAIKDGEKVTYQFFKSTTGMPVNTCLGKSTTNEPNGVEIKIACNQGKDFAFFEHEVGYYCRWLDYPVKCNKELNSEKPKFSIEDGFGLRESSNDTPLVIVGGIPYPINFQGIQNFDQYSGGISGVNPKYIILFAKIGDVDLISSREEVEYTDKTKAFLTNASNKIKLFYEKYKAEKTIYEIVKNRQAWEINRSTAIPYGFYIKTKNLNKWSNKNSSDSAYSKYVIIDDINKKYPWSQICKRIKENVRYVAFVNKVDLAELQKIGIPGDRVIHYDSLPTQKRGKLAKYKVITINDGILKKARTDTLNKIVVYVNGQQADYFTNDNKDVYEYLLLNDKDLSIVIDDKDTLRQYARDKYGIKHSVNYDSVSVYLESLGYIERNQSQSCKYDYIREKLGLTSGETVCYEDKFPLLRSFDRYRSTCIKHAKFYVDWVVSNNPTALDNKNVVVLSKNLYKP